MADTDSRLIIKQDGELTLVSFKDRNILDESSIQSIGDHIGRLVDEAPVPKMVIDFKDVDHLSSAALGTLITINNKIRNKDGQLRLSNIDKNIYQVFQITRLNTLFQIHATTPEAIKSIS